MDEVEIQPEIRLRRVWHRWKKQNMVSGDCCILLVRFKLLTFTNHQTALVFASGLATQANITQLLQAGDHIVAGDELYGGTNRYFRTCAVKFNVTTSYVDFCDPKKVAAAIQPNTKLVWLETPTNPLLKVSDIEAVSKVVKAANPNIIIVVDNTFLSPYFQSPLTLGADIVMNSITKYINGKCGFRFCRKKVQIDYDLQQFFQVTPM